MPDITSTGHRARASSSASRHRRTSSSHSQPKPWETRGHLYRTSTSHSRPDREEVQPISRHSTRTSTRSKPRDQKWWKIRLFKGVIDDVKRRAPFYISDWKDAWDYRVVPATVYMVSPSDTGTVASYHHSAFRRSTPGCNSCSSPNILHCLTFAPSVDTSGYWFTDSSLSIFLVLCKVCAQPLNTSLLYTSQTKGLGHSLQYTDLILQHSASPCFLARYVRSNREQLWRERSPTR